MNGSWRWSRLSKERDLIYYRLDGQRWENDDDWITSHIKAYDLNKKTETDII